jgi:hypothetical protein
MGKMTTRPLLDVRHGSHLYGLARPDSDEDRYVVLLDRPPGNGAKYRWAKQKIRNGVDTMTLDLHTFLDMACRGVPQALEAMFAPEAEVDKIAALRRSWRASGAEVWHTYRRTIRHFLIDYGDLKRRRHALRLAVNLEDLMRYARFEPRLTPELAAELTRTASLNTPEYLDELQRRCPLNLELSVSDIRPLL